MTTLTEFLEQRLAEDEAVAREAIAERVRVFTRPGADGKDLATAHDPDMVFMAWPDTPVPVVIVGPERVLAEVAAKRKRVELFSSWNRLCAPDDWPEGEMHDAALADAGRHLLRVEAQPYADHPDFRSEWSQ